MERSRHNFSKTDRYTYYYQSILLNRMMTEMTERERAILMISVDASRKAMADVARELLAEQRNQESAQKLADSESHS